MCRCAGGCGSECKLLGRSEMISQIELLPTEGVITESSGERQELEAQVATLRASLAQERARSRQLKTVIEQKVLEHQRR